jgi:N-acetylglucosamine malate deacetylase 1
MRWILAAVLLTTAAQAETPRPARTILAIGAHAGDMELTTGALLAKQSRRGDRVVILHLTPGERGNPKLSPDAYGAQKRREATEAAKELGAEALFGPYRDGELPDDEDSRRYVAGVIRQIQPTHVFTHARQSMHKDHAAAHAIVNDAVLLASLQGVALEAPVWRGIRGIWYAENWEDAEDFTPYLYVDVSDAGDAWKDAVSKYEFVRGGISTFAYLDYYTALQALRGAEVRKKRAVAFDVSPYSKRQVIDELR